ncbi:MAG: hypothetical protein NTX17_00955 [Candidatus Eisenbacteria bacterium]|nr:hypothetical protein [Candidatus Eisenbacteria bacterium]
MAEGKKVTIVRAGGTASAEVEIFPGDNAQQVCTLVAPQLGLPAEGSYKLLGSDGKPISGDATLDKLVQSGDKLTLARMEVGG